MKRYEVKFEVKVWERENGGFYEHTITICPRAHNTLEAINIGIEFLDSLVRGWEEEAISKKLGREFKVNKWELSKILSAKTIKEEDI